MKKFLGLIVIINLISCDSKNIKPKKLNENMIKLIINKNWILKSEKDPIMGFNSVPKMFHLSKQFYIDGTGEEFISLNLKKTNPKSSNFKYSIVNNLIIIKQDDGNILKEEIKEINDEKLITFIPKFKNERIYAAKKIIDTSLNKELNEFPWVYETENYSISFPQDWAPRTDQTNYEGEFVALTWKIKGDICRESICLDINKLKKDETIDEILLDDLKTYKSFKARDLKFNVENNFFSLECQYLVRGDLHEYDMYSRGPEKESFEFKNGYMSKVLEYHWIHNGYHYELSFLDDSKTYDLTINNARKIMDSFILR
jgi:hypothetical protein